MNIRSLSVWNITIIDLMMSNVIISHFLNYHRRSLIEHCLHWPTWQCIYVSFHQLPLTYPYLTLPPLTKWEQNLQSMSPFVKMRLAAMSLCLHSVIIFTGSDTTAPVLIVWKGHWILNEIATSTGTTLHLQFTSDGSIEDNGFKIKYHTIPGKCTSNNGVFSFSLEFAHVNQTYLRLLSLFIWITLSLSMC